MTSHMMRFTVIVSLWVMALGLAACAAPAGDPPATTSPAPEGVLRAREAVLAFLRQGANECVPPKQATWSVAVEAAPPAGYEVYRFSSGDCRMTITVPQATEDARLYHVALGDGPTGFCWQAVVDSDGQIVLTGNAAQTDTTLGNPAKNYCEARGYTYEVITTAGGQACGVCVFDDRRGCNAWAYFHGACAVDDAGPIEQ